MKKYLLYSLLMALLMPFLGTGKAMAEAKGTGTLADPYNAAGACAAVKDLTWTSNTEYESTDDVYVKGKISRIANKGTFTEGGTYGNASFYISEDGTEKDEFYCFRILYLGNKKFEEGQTDIKVGDEVVVCGKLMNYRNNTPETVSGKAYLYSLSEDGGSGETPSGSGTLADPYNAAGACAAVKDLTWTSNTEYESTDDVYVKGKISRIANKGTFTEGGTYGNASFYISEDGTEKDEFYCFRILYLGNKKFETGQTDIKVGDEVVVCGKLMNYRENTPETVSGKAYLYSLNGATGETDTRKQIIFPESDLLTSLLSIEKKVGDVINRESIYNHLQEVKEKAGLSELVELVGFVSDLSGFISHVKDKYSLLQILNLFSIETEGADLSLLKFDLENKSIEFLKEGSTTVKIKFLGDEVYKSFEYTVNFKVNPPTPSVVDITVEPADGTDIYDAYAAKVKEVTDAGNIVGNITINLAANASYTISKTIVANKDISIMGIRGNYATINASSLEGNMIEMATLENPTEWIEANLELRCFTVKGLKKALFFSNSKNYVFTEFEIYDCIIEQAGDATTIDFTKGSTALKISLGINTFYAPTATTKAFYSSQGGQKVTEYKEDATQDFTIVWSTMYNLAKGKNFFSHRQSNQKWMTYFVSDNIFVNCGKSGQVIKGMNGGQGGTNPTWKISGNFFNYDGADTSASESTGDEAEPATNYKGLVTFTDPTAPDFNAMILIPSTYHGEPLAGDLYWKLTFAKGLAINITDSEGGTVTASPSYATEGNTITLTVTPAEGYELESLTVKDADDAEVTVTDNKFTMPATDVTVMATFKKLPVDVNITVESGNDIAAAVETAADGAPIKSITVTLAENGEYAVSKSLTSQGNVTINGAEGATIDASSLSAPLITLDGATSNFAPKADGTDSDHFLVESVTIKDVTIKGQKGALLRDEQKSLVETVTIENSVVEMPASNKNVLDFNGKGYAGKVIVKNSTIWSAGKNTGFFAQYGSRPKNVNGDLLQEFDFQNSTIVNIANGKNFCNLKQNGTAQNVYTIKNNIFVDCGKANQVVVGFNNGQTSPNPVWDVEGNTFFANGADGSEAETSKAGQKNGEDIVKNSLTSDPEFADAANGDFTVGESTEQAELETGDPRWLVEYVGGEGDATDLLAEIEEAKKLLKYSMPYYDENNEESPETEGKALVDAIRDAEEKVESGATQKKLDKALEDLVQAEIDYTTALMDYELAESEAILAGADPADELAAEIQRLYDTQDVVREDYSNQPKHIKNYADEIDKAQKAYLRNAINELIPEAQAMADSPEVKGALDKANEALEGDSSEDLFDALNGLLEAMETATGIRGIEANDTDDAPVYNMGGQRVSSHAKGIVIKNGKKIIRK